MSVILAPGMPLPVGRFFGKMCSFPSRCPPGMGHSTFAMFEWTENGNKFYKGNFIVVSIKQTIIEPPGVTTMTPLRCHDAINSLSLRDVAPTLFRGALMSV